MKTRHFEFICNKCGVGYLRDTPNIIAHCPNPSCLEPYMNLIFMIELADLAPFVGYPTKTRIEPPIDK
jgi:hypothetical protein